MGNKALQLNDDVSFQRKEWFVERVTWTILGALLIAALLGIFGTGPLSRTSEEVDGVTVSYERFTRKISYTDLEIRVADVRNETFTVQLSDSWVSNSDITQITPEPDSATRTDDGLALTFSAVPDTPAVVSIQYRPNKIGRLSATVGIQGGPVVEFAQFIYP
jgi:hypothetical protein